MRFNNDGSKLYVMGQNGDDINEYTMAGEEPSIKSGLINTTEGATPFYTNATSNPLTTNSLSEGQSQTITFWVNATGDLNTTHTFFAFANLTSNLSISNFTGEWNVSIVGEPQDTTAPTISIISPTNITYYTSTIWFNATANEEIDTWIVNYNGTNVTLGSINSSLNVEDGTHHLYLYANDTSGNWGVNDSIWFSVKSQ